MDDPVVSLSSHDQWWVIRSRQKNSAAAVAAVFSPNQTKLSGSALTPSSAHKTKINLIVVNQPGVVWAQDINIVVPTGCANRPGLMAIFSWRQKILLSFLSVWHTVSLAIVTSCREISSDVEEISHFREISWYHSTLHQSSIQWVVILGASLLPSSSSPSPPPRSSSSSFHIQNNSNKDDTIGQMQSKHHHQKLSLSRSNTHLFRKRQDDCLAWRY